MTQTTTPLSNELPHRFADRLGERAGVYLWREEYISFDRRNLAPQAVRGLLARLRTQAQTADGILHAVYAGPKAENADIENTLFYNIQQGAGTLGGASRGLRFEWWPDPDAAALDGFGCRYSYRDAHPDAGFDHWRKGRTLASWPTIDLGPLRGEKRLAPVWLALRQSTDVTTSAPRTGKKWFGLSLIIDVPTGRSAANATFIKQILDGTVAAFTHEIDASHATAAAAPIAKQLRDAGHTVSDGDIRDLLHSGTRSALGAHSARWGRLFSHGAWHPEDEECVAVNIQFRRSSTSNYGLSGRLYLAEHQ